LLSKFGSSKIVLINYVSLGWVVCDWSNKAAFSLLLFLDQSQTTKRGCFLRQSCLQHLMPLILLQDIS